MTTRYISVTDTAKLIRAALKRAFPGFRFSVRCDKYAGGASIDVGWTDGPTTAQVNRIVKVYEGATFDGMTDYRGGKVHELAGERVHFGANWVHTNRTLSPAFKVKLWEAWNALEVGERVELANRRDVRPDNWDRPDQDTIVYRLSVITSLVPTSEEPAAPKVISTY